MSRMPKLFQSLSLALLLHVAAVTAAPLHSHLLNSNNFDDKAIEKFTCGTRVSLPEEDVSDVSVSDRILFDGYLVAIQRIALPDGTMIDWGFKYQEGNLQSVLIYDPSGHPRLLAAVSNAGRVIADSYRPLATNMAQYQQDVRERGGAPSATIFVRDKRDLEMYLPYLKRWLQADLLGMNVDCAKPGMAEACRFAGQVAVPMKAYLLKSKRAPEELAVPSVKAADVPLEAFTQ